MTQRAGPESPTSAISSAPPRAPAAAASATASSYVPSTTTTSAPSDAIASRRAASDRSGRKTRARSPRSRATRATARPWLPALTRRRACATSGASRSARSVAHDAPRILNAGSPKRPDSSLSRATPLAARSRSGVGASPGSAAWNARASSLGAGTALRAEGAGWGRASRAEPPASATRPAATGSVSARLTHSTAAWAPSPPGPNSTVGMPAAAMNAESAQ